MMERDDTWVYVRSEPNLFTVGFYDPAGNWQSDSDHGSKDDAVARVHYLNGGHNAELLAALEEMLKAHEQLMPGIAHIALQDYANINQAPIRARAAIHNAKSE